jgi:hypothetical protein
LRQVRQRRGQILDKLAPRAAAQRYRKRQNARTYDKPMQLPMAHRND